MTHRLKMKGPWLITSLLSLLLTGGCDPEMTGELIDASMGEPVDGGEDDHGGDVQTGLQDTPPPSIDCDGFSFEPELEIGMCEPFEAEFTPSIGATHVPEEQIIYEQTPPTSGPHRPQWGRWGEYSWIPPERWLHNLEHGGIAFLYHPCAPTELVDALRELARAYPADDTGEFRWILGPYENMETPFAVVAWEWRALLSCLDEADVIEFIERVYRQAPEDVVGDGSFTEGWIGR